MNDETERRREPRITTHIEVDYASENTFLFAYITDISAMGIFVKTDAPLDVGTTLHLRFTPPEAVLDALEVDTLELRGEVMWNTRSASHSGNPGMGIRFLDLGARQRSRLLDLVRAIAYLDDRQGN